MFGGCRFCGGRGCLACQGERERERKEQAEAITRELACWRRVATGTETDGDRARLALMHAMAGERGILPMPMANALVAEQVDAGADEQAVRNRLVTYLEIPEPVMTIRLDDPNGMDVVRRVFGAESVKHAFGPAGSGAEEIAAKLEAALAEHPDYRGHGSHAHHSKE